MLDKLMFDNARLGTARSQLATMNITSHFLSAYYIQKEVFYINFLMIKS